MTTGRLRERRHPRPWVLLTAGSVAILLAMGPGSLVGGSSGRHDAVPLEAQGGNAVTAPSPTAPPRLDGPSPSVAPVHAVPERAAGVYSHDGAGAFSPAVRGFPERVYVPNTLDGTITEIDPSTLKVIRTLRVGGEPHHITPSWDLRHLYVDNPYGNSLQTLSAKSGRVTGSIPVATPYNLYFTPDGTMALVVAEADRKIEFRDTHSWKLLETVPVPWPGVDHMDFSADGRYLLASCEYSGMVARISTTKMAVTGTARVGGRPVDVKVSPDGRWFFVANQGLSGVSVINPRSMRQVGFLRTGAGAHGFAVSRDGRLLYLSNRLAGTISVISFRTRSVVGTWHVGGTPDMLQVSPDGKQLWMSNRFGNTVAVVSTATGKVIEEIMVGRGPHGLAYFPQPGRFSIGHNGVYR